MKKVILRNFCVLIVLAAMLFSYTGIVYATETGDGSNAVNSGENEVNDAETSEYDAEDITDAVNVSYDGSVVKMSCDSSFCQIYIEWKTIPGEWNLYDGTSETAYGTKGFLHEYVSFESGVNYAEIRKSDSTEIRNIYFFTDGTVPDWVQVWDDPCKKADIMLCSTHSDDEQLFFLGILPYYAGELGLNVQVVYFVNHNDAESRPHELLNGLWTVGVRNYPMIGEAPDLYSENLDDAIAGFADYGYSEDFFIEYQVEAIRRFKPLVVIGHDVNGEYSHGAHILNTHTLRQALEISNDASVYPGSAEKYGVWDVPKTYLHLWEKNQIYIDWDIPLENFGGMTAYEVSLEGFKCHESQHWTWFSKWIGLKSDWGVTKAADIETYSPCEFGLYRTLVGEDIEKDGFLENITLYGDLSEDEHEEQNGEESSDESSENSTDTDSPEMTEPPAAASQSESTDVTEENGSNENNTKLIIIAILTAIALLIATGALAVLIKRIRNGER